KVEQVENLSTVSPGKKKNKGVIAAIVGVVALVVIVFLVFNMKNNNEEQVASESSDDEDSIEGYSIEGLAEHYGIDENLLTYEEMSDVVNKLESEYEEDLKGLDNAARSLFIEEIIKEDYGKWNASAYNRGILIKDGMSNSDKQQVIAALLGSETYKRLVNPINHAYQVAEENDFVTQKGLVDHFIQTFSSEGVDTRGMLIGDTGGFYTFGNVHFGYPIVLSVGPKDTL